MDPQEVPVFTAASGEGTSSDNRPREEGSPLATSSSNSAPSSSPSDVEPLDPEELERRARIRAGEGSSPENAEDAGVQQIPLEEAQVPLEPHPDAPLLHTIRDDATRNLVALALTVLRGEARDLGTEIRQMMDEQPHVFRVDYEERTRSLTQAMMAFNTARDVIQQILRRAGEEVDQIRIIHANVLTVIEELRAQVFPLPGELPRPNRDWMQFEADLLARIGRQEAIIRRAGNDAPQPEVVERQEEEEAAAENAPEPVRRNELAWPPSPEELRAYLAAEDIGTGDELSEDDIESNAETSPEADDGEKPLKRGRKPGSDDDNDGPPASRLAV